MKLQEGAYKLGHFFDQIQLPGPVLTKTKAHLSRSIDMASLNLECPKKKVIEKSPSLYAPYCTSDILILSRDQGDTERN